MKVFKLSPLAKWQIEQETWGLMCPLAFVRLLFFINQNGDKLFSFSDPLTLFGVEVAHAYFVCTERKFSLHILQNRTENGYLLPEFPTLDYVLVLQDAPADIKADWRTAIRELPEFMFVSVLPAKTWDI